jgi:membrane protein involved in colicin uptake
MNDLKTFAADPTMKRGDVAQAVEMKWPEWATQTADSLTQKVSKLSEQAANLQENDPKRQEIMKQVEKTIKAQQLLESIPADKIKQTLFPDIAQYEQNTKAALAAERQVGQEAMLTDRIASSEKVNQARIESASKTAELRARTSEEIAQARLDAARGIAEAKANKGPSETELRAQRKELADNESKLLLNKDKEGAGPLADLHNERSEKPYAYKWKPGKLYGGEYTQIKLPKIKGKQVTAKDVYDTASQRGITYDEVLKAIGVK